MRASAVLAVPHTASLDSSSSFVLLSGPAPDPSVHTVPLHPLVLSWSWSPRNTCQQFFPPTPPCCLLIFSIMASLKQTDTLYFCCSDSEGSVHVRRNQITAPVLHDCAVKPDIALNASQQIGKRALCFCSGPGLDKGQSCPVSLPPLSFFLSPLPAKAF